MTPNPAIARRPSRILREASLILVLLVLLFVVLLPLFWMILTSFKVRGTAFQLAFLPRTTVTLPAMDRDAFPLPNVEAGARFFHTEVTRPEATTVELWIHPHDGEDPTLFPMTRIPGGVWLATAGPIEADEITFILEVNGELELPTPAELEERHHRLEAGVTLDRNVEPTFLVYREGDEIHYQIWAHEDSRYAMMLDEDRRVSLTDGAAGRTLIAGTLAASGESQFRIVERRPLSTAVAERYTLSNFRTILTSEDFNFLRFFFNSLIVATSAGIITVFLCTLAGYVFATKRFHFRDQLFALLLLSMLVPGMIYMVPQFSITLQLGLLNTYTGMVIPHVANVFGLFLLRQYVMQIPRDLFAAAEIDGAREHQIFRSIVIPVCLPIMVTLFLLVFVGQWSNFLWQLIVNTGATEMMTLPVGLQQFKGQHADDWETIMAGACFSIIPVAVLFMSAQRYFLEGLTAGAVKE